MPITDLLRHNAQVRGTDIAIVEISPRSVSDRIVTLHEFEAEETFPDDAARREVTWKYIDEQANRVANFCLSCGLGKGTRVALLMKNALEWFPLYFGVMRSGALVVPISFRNTPKDTKNYLELTQTTAIFFGPGFSEHIELIHRELPEVNTLISLAQERMGFEERYFECVSAASSADPGIPLPDDDDAAIYFTSGTTGQPKAILHTHATIMSAAVTERTHHNQNEDDVFLCLAPLFHTGAMMHWLGSLASCSKAVLLRDTKPQSILNAISEEGVTVAFMLVPWVQDILQDVENGKLDFKDFTLAQWRLMHIGAQPVPAEMIKRWQRYFPGQQYDTNYGLSESMGPGCVHLGIENIHKVGAIGKAGFGWQTEIIGEDGKPVDRGAIGELIVKGPGVMRQYFNNEKATAEALRGGWLFTGDMGYEDEDWFIWLVDRKKDVVISGGENIYPIHIEDHIRALAKVKDVAVIGAHDKRLVEIPIAIVSLKDGAEATEDELAVHCEALPKYKRPRRFIFAEVPRNPTGKIEKPRLREMYGGSPQGLTQKVQKKYLGDEANPPSIYSNLT